MSSIAIDERFGAKTGHAIAVALSDEFDFLLRRAVSLADSALLDMAEPYRVVMALP